jgi:CHAD domain-containing protein
MKSAALPRFALKQTRTALARLSARLRRAARHPKDPEAIHDLRVSIRRFTQCLVTFEGLFDPAAVKDVRKQLRKLMKRCGEVRNADIAQALLHTAGVPDRSRVYGKVAARRVEAEEELIRYVAKKRWAGFAKRVSRQLIRRKALAAPLRAVRLSAGPQPAGLVPAHLIIDPAVHLPALAGEFFRVGAEAAAKQGDYAALHRFRLQAKRFRYTLELFEPFYGRKAALILAGMRELQDRLGEINDCLTTLELVGRHPSAAWLVKELLAKRDQKFHDCWQTRFTKKRAAQWSKWLSQPSA